MTWSGHQMIDPNDIETRFSVEDGMSYMDSVFDEPSEEAQIKIERVRQIMESLPPREADFVDLYYFKKLKQTDIAAIFGVSQPTVCYRLQRATFRIQFLLQLPDVSKRDVERAMKRLLVDPLDAKIMVLMWETTCQSEVAKRLGVTQGLVRHRFLRSIIRMQEDKTLTALATVFEAIALNLNVLREVKRPVWDSRVTHVID